MKTLYIQIVILLTLFSSCNDDFLLTENPNNVDSNNYYQTETDINTAVNGTYAKLRQFTDLFYLYLSEGRSNNYYSGTSNAQRDLVDISRFNVTSELSSIEDAWVLGYSLISSANKVLSEVDGIEFSSEDDKNTIKAQVRFLRAFSHFELMRTFGDIPIVNNVISPEEGVNIERSSRVKVYEFIKDDLDFAIDFLPKAYSSGEVGRVTMQAAKALLAKVYLTWAQYPLYDNAMLENAITILNEIVSTSGYMTWSNNFQDIFKANNDNKNCLFEIQYYSGTSGLGATFPSQFLANSMKEFAYTGGVPRFAPSNDLMKVFDKEGDMRFDATFDTTYINNFYMSINENIITKWFETGLSLLNRSDWPHNYPVIRPAEIYLMLAEALVVKNGAFNDEVIGYLNKTRLRAGLEKANPATTQEFENELLNEYRREFVGEGVYWHFLVRSGKAVEVMNQWLANTSQNVSINVDKLIYPVPYSQMVLKPGLYEQNPGY